MYKNSNYKTKNITNVSIDVQQQGIRLWYFIENIIIRKDCISIPVNSVYSSSEKLYNSNFKSGYNFSKCE